MLLNIKHNEKNYLLTNQSRICFLFLFLFLLHFTREEHTRLCYVISCCHVVLTCSNHPMVHTGSAQRLQFNPCLSAGFTEWTETAHRCTWPSMSADRTEQPNKMWVEGVLRQGSTERVAAKKELVRFECSHRTRCDATQAVEHPPLTRKGTIPGVVTQRDADASSGALA